MTVDDDELDALLDGAPIVLTDDLSDVDDDLEALVTRTAPPVVLEVDQVDLDDILDGECDVSYVTEYSSSKLDEATRKLKFRQVAKLDLRKHPVRLAKQMLENDAACKPVSNPIDKLDENQIIQLVAALQQAEAKVLEGNEVALILAPGKSPSVEMPADRRLALHLNATPVDGVVVLKLDADSAYLRRALLSRGLKQGLDYEFIEPTALLPYERSFLNGLLTSRKGSKLRILRRLSKKRANGL